VTLSISFGSTSEVGDCQTLGGVACYQHLFDPPARIVERGAHRVQAIKPHQPVGGVFAGRHRLARPEGRRAAGLLVAVGATQLGVVGVFGGLGRVVIAHGRLL
jgi:hypothetical protein